MCNIFHKIHFIEGRWELKFYLVDRMDCMAIKWKIFSIKHLNGWNIDGKFNFSRKKLVIKQILKGMEYGDMSKAITTRRQKKRSFMRSIGNLEKRRSWLTTIKPSWNTLLTKNLRTCKIPVRDSLQLSNEWNKHL